MKPIFLALSVSALVLAGVADAASSAPAPSGLASAGEASAKRVCFYKSRVSKWAAPNDSEINVRLETGAVYRVTLATACTGLTTYKSMAFDTNGDTEVCERRNHQVVSRGNVGPLRCPIASIRLLTPEAAAALPDDARP